MTALSHRFASWTVVSNTGRSVVLLAAAFFGRDSLRLAAEEHRERRLAQHVAGGPAEHQLAQPGVTVGALTTRSAPSALQPAQGGFRRRRRPARPPGERQPPRHAVAASRPRPRGSPRPRRRLRKAPRAWRHAARAAHRGRRASPRASRSRRPAPSGRRRRKSPKAAPGPGRQRRSRGHRAHPAHPCPPARRPAPGPGRPCARPRARSWPRSPSASCQTALGSAPQTL